MAKLLSWALGPRCRASASSTSVSRCHLLPLPDCALVFLPVHGLFAQPEGTSPLPSPPCPDMAMGTLVALCLCPACGVQPVAVTSEHRDVASFLYLSLSSPWQLVQERCCQLPVSFCSLLLTGRLWVNLEVFPGPLLRLLQLGSVTFQPSLIGGSQLHPCNVPCGVFGEPSRQESGLLWAAGGRTASYKLGRV